ncbi:MAG: hypothetical protein ACYCV7_01380 [Acidimicrobiales bacterium]
MTIDAPGIGVPEYRARVSADLRVASYGYGQAGVVLHAPLIEATPRRHLGPRTTSGSVFWDAGRQPPKYCLVGLTVRQRPLWYLI